MNDSNQTENGIYDEEKKAIRATNSWFYVLLITVCLVTAIGLLAYAGRHSHGAVTPTASVPAITTEVPIPTLDLSACRLTDVKVVRTAGQTPSLRFNCPVVLDYSGK